MQVSLTLSFPFHICFELTQLYSQDGKDSILKLNRNVKMKKMVLIHHAYTSYAMLCRFPICNITKIRDIRQPNVKITGVFLLLL